MIWLTVRARTSVFWAFAAMARRDSGHVLLSDHELMVLPVPIVAVAHRVAVRSGHGSFSKSVLLRKILALRRRIVYRV